MSRDEMLLRFGCGGDLMAGVDQFLLCGVAAEAEANRRARLAIVESKRAQHVARPPRTARAGAPQRERNSAQIGEQSRGVDTVAANVEVALVAALDAAVDDPVRTERLDRRRPKAL